MNDGKEGRGAFGITRGNGTPALQAQKSVFNQMAQTIKMFVIGARVFAIAFGRDDGFHALCFSIRNNGVGVVRFVSQQSLRREPFDQARSLCAISSGTFCNKDSDRHTKRIHGQMHFCVKPPFVRLIASLPPLAPAACG